MQKKELETRIAEEKHNFERKKKGDENKVRKNEPKSIQ